MEFELGNVGVIYPNEKQSSDRKFRIRTNGEILHLDFVDPIIEMGGFNLDIDQVKLLVDTLNLILKNKLIE